MLGRQENYKKEFLELIQCWEKERQRYPGWYIAPVGKREPLSFYTRDEDLLWRTKGLTIQDKLDFSYELVWRYETGMRVFTQKIQKNIYLVWKDYYDQKDFSVTYNNEKWFYIGQALLRDFREDMNWDKWNELYSILVENSEFLDNGKDELTIEYIKQLFFKMQITDVRDKIQQFTCPKQQYAIRLQKYGLMAECGLSQGAYKETKQLIEDLMESFSQVDEDNTQNKVYFGSILSCAQDLMSLVMQGVHPFDYHEELKELWDNQEEFQKFYDFEREKYKWNNNLYNYYCKHYEVAFELDRNIRTTHWGSDGAEKVYCFYRVLDRMGIPLSVGMTKLLPDQEIEFIGVLLKSLPYLGSFMLLRTANSKAVKTIITRKFCIESGFDKCRNIFEYVYSSIEKNIESMHVNSKRGNVYSHLLKNGLEILKRFVSVASLTQQKKLLTLMCKLIDANLMQEYRVMDMWIAQVLGVVNEKTKAQYLNEILMLSTNNRSRFKNENSVDPFEVISSSNLAQKYYEQENIEAPIINELISYAKESDVDRQVVIMRLQKLYRWKQLSHEQIEQFRLLIWSKVSEETGLPDLKQYFGAAFLEWPTPEGTDVKGLVRRYIMNPDWYSKLKQSQLPNITMGGARIFNEIKCLNSLYPEFLSTEDKTIIFEHFVEYWEAGVKQLHNHNVEVYREEFSDRYQALVRVISSFNITELDLTTKQHLERMFLEMKSYSINTLAARTVICCNLSEGESLIKEIIDSFYSADKDVVFDATEAAQIFIKKYPDSNLAHQVVYEIIRLIRYGRQPGLRYFLIIIYNLAYLRKLDLTEEMMDALNKSLLECNQYTSYDKISELSETAIQDRICLRRSCAATAYMLNSIITGNANKKYRRGIDKWKDICTGAEAQYEFAEVKKAWCQ